jgi:chromosome segregation ATPase
MSRTIRGFRRRLFGGLRAGDVESAVARLEQRTHELEAELAIACETARGVSGRLTAAEDTLAAFHDTIEHMSTLLSLADERAQQMQEAAEADAERIRSAAQAHVREADGQVEVLTARRRQIIDELAALRTSVTELAEQLSPVPGASVYALPTPAPLHLPQAGAGS